MTFTLFPGTGPAPALYWFRRFDGRPSEAGEARRFVGALLPDRDRMDEVLLAVDELVVNALRHTRSGRDGGSFTVEVAMTADCVAVSVVDEGGPSAPAVVEAGDLDECGRGLRLVSLTATAWGWHGNATGRTVHATFALDADRPWVGQACAVSGTMQGGLSGLTGASARLPSVEEAAEPAHTGNGVTGSMRAVCAFTATGPS